MCIRDRKTTPGYRFTYFSGNVRVVYRVGGIAAKVLVIMSCLGEQLYDKLLETWSVVVTANGDTHY